MFWRFTLTHLCIGTKGIPYFHPNHSNVVVHFLQVKTFANKNLSKNFCKQKLLQVKTFASKNFCKQKLLQVKTFASKMITETHPDLILWQILYYQEFYYEFYFIRIFFLILLLLTLISNWLLFS